MFPSGTGALTTVPGYFVVDWSAATQTAGTASVGLSIDGTVPAAASVPLIGALQQSVSGSYLLNVPAGTVVQLVNQGPDPVTIVAGQSVVLELVRLS